MEYIKCPKCGSDTPSALSRCRNCGERLPKESVIDGCYIPKIRNGFVTFWLWACFIVNILFMIGYIALLFSSKGLWSGTPEPLPLRLLWIIESSVIVCGYWLLIAWKKNGFYILAIISALNAIINLYVERSLLSFFMPIASIIILYGILQISKNGRSCWQLLS